MRSLARPDLDYSVRDLQLIHGTSEAMFHKNSRQLDFATGAS
jgi:hypothetical protein